MGLILTQAQWQGLMDDYRTYCGITSFSDGKIRHEEYLSWRDN